jgi:hypothetical protein
MKKFRFSEEHIFRILKEVEVQITHALEVQCREFPRVRAGCRMACCLNDFEIGYRFLHSPLLQHAP